MTDLNIYREAFDEATDPADLQALMVSLEADLAEDWQSWLRYLFPLYVTHGFGDHHALFWEWIWSIRPGERAKPNIDIWSRGGAKSTSVELGVVALGARRARRYVLYVCETQDQADDHVGNIASLLESTRFSELYPALGSRMVGKFGASKGWRRNRVRTAAGFTIDAIGLDTAARGVKLDEDRPDLIVLDDLDDALDAPGTTERKINALTRTILPAEAEHSAVLGVQNLVIPEGIFARLAGSAQEPADFLVHRQVSGPIPAVWNLTLGRRDDGSALIIDGTPAWEGQDLIRCQALLDEIGETAFLIECQHEVGLRGGGMFDHLIYQRCTRDEVPTLLMTTVWVDPAVTDTDRSDSMGIEVDGITASGTIYRLRSWEQRSSPETALGLAIAWAYEEGAQTVGVETDQGGDTWRSVFEASLATVLVAHPDWRSRPQPAFVSEKAGAGNGPKVERAARMLADYEKPGRRIIHVLGSNTILEASLNRFPRAKPFDLTDAAFWSWNYLRKFGRHASTNRSALTRARIPTGRAF